MAKKKKNKGGMSPERAFFKKAVGLGGKFLGAVTAFSGVIGSAQNNLPSGNIGGFTHDVTYHYSGYDTSTGQVNWSQTVTGVTTVLAGVGIAKLFGWFAKHI